MNFWNSCLDFFKTEETRRNLKENIIQPMVQIIYNEIYIYMWLICVYHVFLAFIILANLFLLLKLLSKNNSQMLSEQHLF